MDIMKLNIRDFKNPNLSLFYYKYFPNLLTEKEKEKKKKADYLTWFCDTTVKPDPNRIAKRIQVIKKLAGNNIIELKNTSRFMCGIGYSSTVEWGFNFDWTSGVPFLPGSSFKGALISYLEFLAGKALCDWNTEQVKLLNFNDTWDKDEANAVFGPQSVKEKPDAGGAVFFDVYPIQGIELEVDVITPHHQKYYSDKTNTIKPADTENPTPIPFLTVKKGATFLYAFRIRDINKVHASLANKLLNLIVEVGQNYGFGAKTSSGYGYFKKV